MKGYAALLIYALLWPLSAAALTEGVSYQCPDGRYVVDTGTPDCPTRQTQPRPGANVTQTSTDVQVTLDQTGGHAYWCIWLDTKSQPTWAQLIAETDGTGSACAAADNSSVSSVDFSDAAVGLMAGREYSITFGVIRNGKRSKLVDAPVFPTLAGSNFIAVSVDGNHLIKNSTSRFLLGLTSWGAVYTLSQDGDTTDIDTYIETAAAAGFDFLQGPILTVYDSDQFPLATQDTYDILLDIDGHEIFTAASSTSVTLNESFWAHIDYFIDKAAAEGLYVALPVIWGSLIDDFFSDTAGFYDYVDKVTTRYANDENIIWIVSGEYQKYAWDTVAGDDTTLTAGEVAVLEAAATIVRDNVHPDALVTFHPDGWKSSSEHFADNDDVDFYMVQSYQSMNQGVIDVTADYELTGSQKKPTLQSELFYEDRLTNTDWEPRMAAYHSFLLGAAGYTYGHEPMWQPSGATPAEVLAGFSATGYTDITTTFRTVTDTYHGSQGVTPNRSLIVSGGGSSADGTDTYLSVAVTEDNDLLAYAPRGDSFALNTTTAGVGSLNVKWINPRTGADEGATTVTSGTNVAFDPPGSPADGNDYLLVIEGSGGGGGGGGGGDVLTGSGLFVGCGVGASDGNTGTSHAQRLASLPENMAVGANVYLQAGCVWEDVDWRLTVGGTSGDRQEINAYCIDTSDSDKPKAWTDGGVGCTAKPEINGTYAPSCGAATGNGSGCEFALNGTNSSAVPTSQHNGIVHLVRAQYVTIENIAIHDSAGNGLQIDEGYDTPSHFIGRGLEFEHILKRAILVARAVEDGNAFFDDITINQASLQIPDGLGGTWSACVSFNSNDATINSGIVMQNTTMTNCGAEGYSTLSIGGVVFRDSYSANSMRVAWFPDASQNVVFERMTAVMSPHPLRPDFKPELFATAVECYGPSLTYDSTGHILRDSVAYNVSGEANFIRVAIEGNAGCPEPHRSNGYDPRTEGFKVGVKVFNNTFFAADTTVFAIKCTICTSDPGAIEMKGNVFVGTSRVQNAEADWDMDYNYWDTAPSDSDASGANDVVGGSGFSNDNSWDADDPPTISDATPGLGSTVLDAGTPLTGSVLDITNYDNWSEFSGGCLLTEAQWEQESYADINCTPRDGATPNMGAVGP